MAPKALLPIKASSHLLAIFLPFTTACGCIFIAISSCKHQPHIAANVSLPKTYFTDISHVPNDTVVATNKHLALINGVYYYQAKPYSGIVKQVDVNQQLKAYASVYQGKLHGNYTSFYEDGQTFEVRQYRNNLATGLHYGYWPHSKTLKFLYHYYEEKREGIQKKWYKNGKPFIFSTYTNDSEDGLQQAWRENGKLYINYVAKNGHTYGLQQSALCYTLLNQEIKTR